MIPEIIFLVEHAREDAHELNWLVCLVPGQGVVMEGSPFSDYAQVEAAFNQGWIDIESKHQPDGSTFTVVLDQCRQLAETEFCSYMHRRMAAIRTPTRAAACV